MSVYFIRDESGLVKIGHARNPWQRLQDLQVASPTQLAIVRVVDGGQKTEKWLHKRFAGHHVRGEWFAFADEMLSVVPPDELPPPAPRRKDRPHQTGVESLREADRLGLLTPRMQRDYAAILGGKT